MKRASNLTVRAPLLVSIAAVLCSVAPDARAEQASGTATVDAAALQSRVAELARRVADLKDRQDIWDASKRYTRGADRHDKDLVRSAFWPEATVSYGEPLRRDEYVDAEESRLSGYAAHQHHITGQTVELDGDSAHVESYVIYFLVPRDTSKDAVGTASPGRPLVAEKTHLGSGRYLERWEQRNGEWKILVREYVEDLALKGETVDYCGKRACLGTWDGSDPSYLRPLEHITPEERLRRGEAHSRHRSPAAGGAAPATDGGSQ